MRKVFDLEITDPIVEAIIAHAERDYPNEACGVVLGTAQKLVRVTPLANEQDKYHQHDPKAFPRTAKHAFRMNELERMRVLDAASEEGLDERIIYHSHCDVGAYFSPEDRAMAVQDGIELSPGVVHLVVSVRDGAKADLAAYRYDKERRTFEEHRLGPPSVGLPDLSRRAMEGKEAARPLPPVGGALTARRIDREEAQRLLPLAEGRRVTIRDEEALQDLRCFAGGHLSPLDGFMRRAEVRSVLELGRLPAGTPWRTPVVLSVTKKSLSFALSSGAIVELVDTAGETLALMAVGDVAESKGRVELGGPVFVVGRSEDDAAESRARILRAGAKRILAVPPRRADVASNLDLSAFDLVMSAGPVEGADAIPLTTTSRSPWLMAAMAQNQGATHVWIEEAGARRIIADSLAIQAWP